MSVYLIDYENKQNLEGIENLWDNDIVYLFYSESRESMKIKEVERIINSSATVRMKQSVVKLEGENKVFHDTLDSQLASFLGYIIRGNDRTAKYYIISGDHGFDYLTEFWKKRSYSVERIEKISDGDSEIKLKKLQEKLKTLINSKDETVIKAVSKIIRGHEKKIDIHNKLVEKYGAEDAEKIYKKNKGLCITRQKVKIKT